MTHLSKIVLSGLAAALAMGVPATSASGHSNRLASGHFLAAGAAPSQAIDLRRECEQYASQGIDVDECVRQATIARDATAKYRTVKRALADGFVRATECEQASQGAMGQHWARVDRVVIQGVDPRTPEFLLYLPTGSGLRLVGVEYEQSALVGGLPHYGSRPPQASKVSPPPVMFGGRTFDGPMKGHVAIQPWHYDLHVWLWERNPAGLFAPYNPSLSCSPAAGALIADNWRRP